MFPDKSTNEQFLTLYYTEISMTNSQAFANKEEEKCAARKADNS